MITYKDGSTRLIPAGAKIQLTTLQALRQEYENPTILDADHLHSRIHYAIAEDIRSIDTYPPEYKPALPG